MAPPSWPAARCRGRRWSPPSICASASSTRDGLSYGVELFDAFAREGVTAVDERYTRDAARAIEGGSAADLPFVRGDDGSIPRHNPDFGRPIAYPVPSSVVMYVRLAL